MSRDSVENTHRDDDLALQADERAENSREQRLLEALLERALPPADPVLQARIVTEVARAASRRRWLAFLPVAASLVLAIAGIALLGGLPAASTLASLPSWSGSGMVALGQGLHDGLTALAAAARVLGEQFGGGLVAGFGLLGLLGAGIIAGVSRRWWRRLVCVTRS